MYTLQDELAALALSVPLSARHGTGAIARLRCKLADQAERAVKDLDWPTYEGCRVMIAALEPEFRAGLPVAAPELDGEQH